MLPLHVTPKSGKTSEGYLIGKGWSSLKRPVGKKIEVVAKTLDRIVEELGIYNIRIYQNKC
jgi:hypothetical protein